jgi:oligosaccharide repeat unit polymerase
MAQQYEQGSLMRSLTFSKIAVGQPSRRHSTPTSAAPSGNPYVVLLSAGLSLLAGALPPLLLDPWRTQGNFAAGQLAYALPTALACFIIALQGIRHGVQGLLSPVTAMLTGCLIFFSAAPLLNPVNSFWAVALYSNPERFTATAGIYLVGVLCFGLGLVWANSLVLPQGRHWLDFAVDANRLWIGFLLVAGGALLLLLLLIRLNRLSPLEFLLASRYFGTQLSLSHPLSRYLDQLFSYQIIAAAALAGAVVALSRQWWQQLIAVLVVALFGLFLLSSGVRSHFLYLTSGAVLVWWGLRWRLADRLVLPPQVLLVGVLALFLATQMIQIRNTPGGFTAYLTQGPRVQNLRSFIDYGIDQNLSLEQVLVAVPAYRPYVGGFSFLSPFVAFVPRELWPNKPTTAWAYMAGYSTIFAASPNAAFSFWGELYLNFGMIGVLLGSLLAGIVAQRWFRFYLAYRQSVPITLLYYMSLAAFAFTVRGDFQAAMTPTIYPMAIVLLLLFLSRR